MIKRITDDEIKNRRHCGNCLWFDGTEEDDFQFCNIMESLRPSWGRCPIWKSKMESEDDVNEQ